ncbi:MAG TPA: hypothetical protein VHW44_06655 [Pseudonocardiaceae bacterium]|jgi:hypothetical protein|nr:hypothetical protein [Pseudonocardiaceae bacterium]
MAEGRDLSTCRLFTGYLPGYRTCTTQVELGASHRRLWVHLASVTRFSVALVADAVDVLTTTLEDDGVCAVPCWHEQRGQFLLGVHPHAEPGVVPYSEREFAAQLTGGPMGVYLHLGPTESERVEIAFTRAVTDSLVEHLRSCRYAMRG